MSTDPAAGPTTRRATIRCPLCGRLNRVDLSRLAQGPKCFDCRGPLRLDCPISATDSDFEELISSATVPALVDFYADWCGPCKVTASALDEFAAARAGEALVLKVDTDRNPVTPTRFGVRGIPHGGVSGRQRGCPSYRGRATGDTRCTPRSGYRLDSGPYPLQASACAAQN